MQTEETPGSQELARRLAPLLAGGEAPLAAVDLAPDTLRQLGFQVEGDRVRIPPGVERLEASRIRDALDGRARHWLTDLATLEVVGSTSTLINELAASRSVHGVARLAELQVQGRGRRGRGWFSPYANNLALSLGARLPQTPDRLGGFSLCAGLAVADRLQLIGVEGVELKWPNDVLVGGRKIAGILVDLHRAASGTEVVIGVGVNFRLPEEAKAGIDQPVTDLSETGRPHSRNLVAAGLISSLVDFIEGFAEYGFAPMTGAFDALHRYQGKSCALLLGSEKLIGEVRGVTGEGELLLEVDGRVRPFASGEVSLRPV